MRFVVLFVVVDPRPSKVGLIMAVVNIFVTEECRHCVRPSFDRRPPASVDCMGSNITGYTRRVSRSQPRLAPRTPRTRLVFSTSVVRPCPSSHYVLLITGD